MRVIHSSYFSNTFNGIDETIGLIEFGSCEEVDELEELAPGIIVNSDHSLFEKDQSYVIQCLGEKCSWSLRASSLNKSEMFKIRKFESGHICLLLHNSLSERLATKSVVGSIIVDKYTEPNVIYTPKDIQCDMLDEYGVRLTYMQAWRAKEAILELIQGDPIQSYAKATYPGSHIRLHKSDDDCFLYAFVALFTSIKGWKYCILIVVVNGTFLKGAYKGTLLTTNTLDAAENDSSWRWFFQQFGDAFGQRPDMCIIFDRHASIIKAVLTIYDEVPHFACFGYVSMDVVVGIRLDFYTFPCVLRTCGGMPDWRMGRKIQAHVIRFSYDSKIDVVNALITMYVKRGDVCSARVSFDGMSKRNRIS
ncbi:uncharacterized protein [Solanum lycopersicum]|uniref:uncharacterized protein n=1 Tax=Solanum lycopersicum TaxID=4081 RepID=UPI003747EE3E